MTYRLQEKPKPKPRRTIVETATPSKIYVHNGTIAHLAFPCWYQEVHHPIPIKPHRRDIHDHIGWPEPTRPDRICQVWVPGYKEPSIGIGFENPRRIHPRKMIDLKGIVPIHLLREGYTSFEVALDASDDVPDSSRLEISAYVQEHEDWVVRVDVFAHDEKALKKPMKYKMTVFALAADTDDHPLARKDIVALTDLIILPSSYGYEEEEISE